MRLKPMLATLGAVAAAAVVWSSLRRCGTAELRRESPRDECERLVDNELDDTFPASDPPSWTMGGSHVSTLHE